VDYTLYKAINGLSGSAFPDDVFKFLANYLPAIIVVLVALAFLVPWSRSRVERRNGASLATASAGVALLIAQPITHLVDRTRPYIDHPAHAHLLISRSHDPSFPSDHATGAFALAFGIWLYDRTLGTVLLVLAAILGLLAGLRRYALPRGCRGRGSARHRRRRCAVSPCPHPAADRSRCTPLRRNLGSAVASTCAHESSLTAARSAVSA